MNEQTAIMIELEGQNYAGPPQPSMESFLPYVPDIVCISFQWSHHTCLRPAMVILLNLIIPERNVENGYDYWSNYSDKSTNLFWPSLIPRSFFRRFLFQQNLQGEKVILGQLVKNMGKDDTPAVLQCHSPTSGILQKSNHASQQRVVLPLSMMLWVHEQWFGHICCI